MKRALVLAALLGACGGHDDAPRDASTSFFDHPTFDAGPADAPGRAVSWTESDAPLLGPERGFYRYVDIASDRDFAFVREGGDTLVYSYVRLDAYRDGPIAERSLDDVQDGLDAARDAGIKVILRFAYNEGPYPDSEPDAPLERVLAHITQVTPLLRANEDVIALVQAGFVGAWGEWHTSTNGLDDDPDARRAILEALLDALPASRSTQLRYPAYKEAIYGEPLEARDASDESRVGHHNDCFVASDSDMGTYPEGERDRWVAYVGADTRFVPMGGETCAVFPSRSTCAFVPGEMERLHFSFINRDYHPEVVASWASGGCEDEIEARLGYRFVLVDGELPEAVRPGGSFRLRVSVRNEGYAAPFNPRPVWLALDGVGAVAIPESDVRRWAAGETSELDVRVRLPASVPAGEHAIALWMPDASERIAARPEYAIRTANEGTWDAEHGWNVLGTIRIDDGAQGGSDAGATALTILE
ncbi:DUF4832 domain-containing protein [Sandaracinus amylolyticus]|uniref:DUF4832 domain-containing protein n=1 Tax=Sandaracinus amylolyticus TaxID=927083 RepID=A0A0F6W257_9BACT|nr:DUF4832 domain-containing protein [Sandaracinus amylolyticus]AKF05377.1 hypothetical protein DB32_002526 [Sandaracinus amylolyticus]